MKNFKKISGFLVLAALFFIGGFYIGFNNIPETKKVYGVENIQSEEKADFQEFWRVWNLINEKHPKSDDVSNQEKIWGAIKGLTESVGDPYTYFFTPKEAEDFNIDLSGEFYGVGMEVGIREDNLVVIAPIKDSPADKSGIRSGDVIIKINETVANSLTVDEAVDLIRGEKGTEVKLIIAREGELEPIPISIIRDLIKIPTLETENRKEEKVFIIRLFDFSRNSEMDFEKALNEFVDSGYKDLVIDLRGNPGGYLGSAINITSWFVESGKPIVIEKTTENEETYTHRANGNFIAGDFDIIVLIDGGSASASEIMAGALQEHDKAKLLGETTFGKGSVQEVIHLKNNTELKITVAEWLTPNGKSISENGLDPDILIPFNDEKYLRDRIDNQLEEAIKELKK